MACAKRWMIAHSVTERREETIAKLREQLGNG